MQCSVVDVGGGDEQVHSIIDEDGEIDYIDEDENVLVGKR